MRPVFTTSRSTFFPFLSSLLYLPSAHIPPTLSRLVLRESIDNLGIEGVLVKVVNNRLPRPVLTYIGIPILLGTIFIHHEIGTPNNLTFGINHRYAIATVTVASPIVEFEHLKIAGHIHRIEVEVAAHG
jgi:hypothetical protein